MITVGKKGNNLEESFHRYHYKNSGLGLQKLSKTAFNNCVHLDASQALTVSQSMHYYQKDLIGSVICHRYNMMNFYTKNVT